MQNGEWQLNENYKNFIVQKIKSSEGLYVKKIDIEGAMVEEFGISRRSAAIHVRKFINEHCWGRDRLAYHYRLSRYRELLSKEDIYDQIKHILPRPGRTRWKW